jgi:nucleotide-binding universal stress UspA family protein
VPHHALDGVRSILVPVDGSEAGYRAVAVAAESARGVKAALHVLHVIEVPRSIPLDATLEGDMQRGEGVLERAERIAGDYGVSVEGDMVQARRAGHAVVDEAVERGVDIIIVGVDYHRPLGDFEVGPLPSYLLEHAPCQVWLIRYPAPDARTR